MSSRNDKVIPKGDKFLELREHLEISRDCFRNTVDTAEELRAAWPVVEDSRIKKGLGRNTVGDIERGQEVSRQSLRRHYRALKSIFDSIGEDFGYELEDLIDTGDSPIKVTECGSFVELAQQMQDALPEQTIRELTSWLHSILAACSWKKNASGAQAELFQVAWDSLGMEIVDLGKLKLRFRATSIREFDEFWVRFLKSVESSEHNQLRLVSHNDLGFWIAAMEGSDPDDESARRHVQALAAFKGKKERVMLVDRERRMTQDDVDQFIKVITSMEEMEFRVYVTFWDDVRIKELPVSPDDFGIMGNLSVGWFESKGSGVPRDLVEWFDPDIVKERIKWWKMLVKKAVWETGQSDTGNFDRLRHVFSGHRS